MGERQTYKFNQPTQPVYTSGSEEAWLSVTNAIGRFYQGYVSDEKREMKGEGKVAGIAAATGDNKQQLKMLDAGTIYGSAYNDAAIKAYGAAIEIDVQDSINQYAVDNSESYDGFNTAVQTYADEFSSGIPDPTFKALALQKIKEVQGTYGRDIYKQQKEKNHLINLAQQSKQFDTSIDVAANKGAESVQKYFSGYQQNANTPFDEMQLDPDGSIALKDFEDTFGKEFQQQFSRIDALLNSMQSVPGNHFKDGDLKGKRDEAVLEIYSAVFMEEYKQAVSDGKALSFKEKFREDAVSYIKSQPHLNAMFSDDILKNYAMTTTGTKADPAMSELIYERMDTYWKSQEEVQKHLSDAAELELETAQTDKFVEVLNGLASQDGKTTIASIVAEQQANPRAYATDDYKFLINAITSGKYEKDDEESVSELEFYLMTTTDTRDQKIDEIKEYSSQGRISWKTVARLGKVVIEDTFGDVTKSADYQNAVQALKPHFERKATAFGQVASQQDKVWMTKAIIELTERVEKGEIATDIYEEIAVKYVGLYDDNTPVGKELAQFYVGKGKDRKIDCAAAKKFVDNRFLKHKNPGTYNKDLQALTTRSCTFE